MVFRYNYRYRALPSRRYRKKRYVTTKTPSSLIAMKNPFSGTNTSPKIPDGKAYDSAGLRLMTSKTITTLSEGEIWIMFFPGINNGIWIHHKGDNVEETSPYPQHFVVTKSGDFFQQSENECIAKWRLVSQALKISLINNDEMNDGWWESIRAMISGHQLREFGLINQNGKFIVGPGTAPAGNTTDPMPGLDMSTLNMVEHPTYSTGKLKDIEKVTFQLKPTGKDHDFINCDLVWKDDGTSPNTAIMDTNFDCIFIKIFGRRAADGNKPSNLLLHAVSNQEVIYDEGAILSRHHTKGENAGRHLLRVKNQINASKASATRARRNTKFGKY